MLTTQKTTFQKQSAVINRTVEDQQQQLAMMQQQLARTQQQLAAQQQQLATMQQQLATQQQQLAAMQQQLSTQDGWLKAQRRWISVYNFIAIRKLKELSRKQVCEILGADYEVKKKNWLSFINGIQSNALQQALLSAEGLSLQGLLATQHDKDQDFASDVAHHKEGLEEQIAIAVEMLPNRTSAERRRQADDVELFECVF